MADDYENTDNADVTQNENEADTAQLLPDDNEGERLSHKRKKSLILAIVFLIAAAVCAVLVLLTSSQEDTADEVTSVISDTAVEEEESPLVAVAWTTEDATITADYSDEDNIIFTYSYTDGSVAQYLFEFSSGRLSGVYTLVQGEEDEEEYYQIIIDVSSYSAAIGLESQVLTLPSQIKYYSDGEISYVNTFTYEDFQITKRCRDADGTTLYKEITVQNTDELITSYAYYDDSDNLLIGYTKSYTYSETDLLTAVTTTNSVTSDIISVSNTYDDSGELTSSITYYNDDETCETTYTRTYLTDGALESLTETTVNEVSASTTIKTYTYTYNDDGTLASEQITDSSGNVLSSTSYEYDSSAGTVSQISEYTGEELTESTSYQVLTSELADRLEQIALIFDIESASAADYSGLLPLDCF